VVLKEREPRYRDIKRRITERGGDAAVVAATVAGRSSAPVVTQRKTASDATPKEAATISASGRAIPPRPRKKTRSGRR
jgi:hypothetical protein